VLDAVRFDIAASARLRDLMLGELNAIGSEDEATKWAHRRLSEKNKLNATDAKHVEEAFRAKLMSFAIHLAEGAPAGKSDAPNPSTPDRRRRKAKYETTGSPVDKSVLVHPEPRRVRDRDHVRFVAQQTCLICGRQPCDAHHLRFTQSRALRAARSVTNSQSRYAGDIIAKFIVTAMKRAGGKSLGSIRPAPREHCGWKRIRKADLKS
jgi:hypothetical protein